ncbi:MAG: DUF4340 domain-containing protein [Planctomycetota bacterium]
MSLLLVAVMLTGVNLWLHHRHLEAQREQVLEGLLVSLPRLQVNEFDLQVEGRKRLLCRRSEGQPWRMVEPFADVISRECVDELHAFLAYARCERSTLSTQEAGLDTPSAALTIRTDDDAVQVFFGHEDSGGRVTYVGLGTRPGEVFRVESMLCGFLKRGQEEFRSQHIFTGSTLNLQAFALEREGRPPLYFERQVTGWSLIKPVTWPVDRERFEQLLDRCWQLRSRGIDTEGEERLEEGAPENVTIRLSGSSGVQQVTLSARPKAIEARAVIRGRPEPLMVGAGLFHELKRATQNTYRRHRLLLSAAPERLQRVEIRRGGQLIRLRRIDQDRIWQCDSPETFYVDLAEGSTLLAKVQGLPVRLFPTTLSNELESKLFRQPRVVVQFWDRDGRLEETLTIGAEAPGGGAYARVDRQQTVVILPEDAVAFFDREWFHWRLRQISSFELQAPTRLLIERGGVETVYRKTIGDAWEMVKPFRSPADDRALYMELFGQTGIGGLQARGFAGEIKGNLSHFGLDPPRIRMVVDYALPNIPSLDIAGKEARLAIDIGNPSVIQGGKVRCYFARVQGDRVVFHLDRRIVELLLKNYASPSRNRSQ